MFANSMHCKIGAALRYAYIFNQNNQIRLDKERKPYIVLVALPFCIPTSIEILFMLRDSLADIKHKITIFIKTHPDYDINKIKRLFGESCWPEAFQIFDENMAEGIKIASILISANSSALVEAVSCGIPSIYIGSRIMTNQNILKDIVTEISCECYAPKELAQKINSYIEVLPSKVEEFKKIGVKIRDLYFTPVSDDTIAPFFDIEELV
jgi:spore coat polysaccharide biosynthesis predicted glycosyltransferase SpsG